MKNYNVRSQRAPIATVVLGLSALVATLFASTSNNVIAKDVVVQADGESWVIRVTAKGEAKNTSVTNDIQFAAFQESSNTELPPPPAVLVSNSGTAETGDRDANSEEGVATSEDDRESPITGETSGYEIPADCPPVMASRYLGVYASIPFLRSEYLANPSYRHEATMEILFGQLRPTVVHKYQPQTVRPGSYDIEYVQPYRYYRYGRRVNYNFWYPGPSIRRPYRSY